LGDVPAHHDQVSVHRSDGSRVAVNPFDVVPAYASARKAQHRSIGIDADDAAAAAGESHGQHAGAAAKIDDGLRFQLIGERSEVVVVWTVRVVQVV